jgi:hypothetical protein
MIEILVLYGAPGTLHPLLYAVLLILAILYLLRDKLPLPMVREIIFGTSLALGSLSLLVALYLCLFMKADSDLTLVLALLTMIISTNQLLGLSKQRKLWLSFSIILISCTGLIAADLTTWQNYGLAFKGRFLGYPDIVLHQGDELTQHSPPRGSRIIFAPPDASGIHYGYVKLHTLYGWPYKRSGVYFGSAMAKLADLQNAFPDEDGKFQGSNTYAGEKQLEEIKSNYVRQVMLAQKQSIRLDYPNLASRFLPELPDARLLSLSPLEQWKHFRTDALRKFIDTDGSRPYYLEPSLLVDFRLGKNGEQVLTYSPNFGKATLLDLVLFPLPILFVLIMAYATTFRASASTGQSNAHAPESELIFFKSFMSYLLKTLAAVTIAALLYCMYITAVVAYECRAFTQPGACFDYQFPHYFYGKIQRLIPLPELFKTMN